MAIRSGLAAQIGIGVESTVGTAVTPTRFYEFTSESIVQTIERVESSGLRAGSRVLRSDRYVSGQLGIEGSVELEVTAGNFGILFKHALGANSTSGSDPYTHVATMLDPFGLGLTVQVGRPGNDGTVRAFTYAGCKISTLDLKCAVGDLLSADLGIVGSTAEATGSITSASYGSGLQVVSFTGAAISVGGSSYPCKDFSLSLDNGLDAERYVLGANTTREPVAASLAEVTGSLTAEFVDLTAYNRVVNATHGAISAVFTGADGKTVTVSIPVARFDGDTPNVGGPEIVEQQLTYKGLFDGSASPVTITTINADSAA